MIQLLESIYNYLKSFNGVLRLLFAPLLVVVGVWISLLETLHSLLFSLLGRIDSAIGDLGYYQFHGDFGAATGIYTAMNTFYPLDFTFEALSVLFALKLAMTIVRIIKSWIPTVS